ncbi:hypothetical protein L1049_027433 [Liquidambar formosana]|uniref:Uncharacterized protein n=1 Tax=Liquidambar formosana TaxID=63359 RepID=A0AAP0RKS3_LIQFO
MTGAHKKVGSNLPKCVSCDEFVAMSDICGLIHLDTKGAPYTWSNGRRIRGHIEMCLDRCLVNSTWLDVWNNTACCTLPRMEFDHNPLLLFFSKFSSTHLCPFRFQKAWIFCSEF